MPDPRDTCLEKCTRKKVDINAPKLMGFGPAHAKIMLIGEAPGQSEDAQGLPFVGSSGQLLDELLQELKLDRKEIYITNAVKCATPKVDVKPTKREITCCRDFLIQEIKIVNPNVIGALGATALEAVLKRTGITRLKNNVFVSEEFGIKVVPVYHPAYILRNPDAYSDLLRGLTLIKQESESTKLAEKKKVKTIHRNADTPEKIDKLLSILENEKRFVIDLETTSLNPHEAKILVIAFSWKIGVGVTVPWDSFSDKQRSKLQELLVSDREKIGHNIKFDMQVLKANGIRTTPPIFDCLPAIALIDENLKDKGLDALTMHYLDLGEYWAKLDNFKKVYMRENKLLKGEFNYGMIPHRILLPYAQCDADATYRLYLRFKKELERQGLIEFYTKYTIPELLVILQMEYRGIKVDRELLVKLSAEYKIKIKQAKKAIDSNDAVLKYEKIKTKRAAKALYDKWENSRMIKSKYLQYKEYIKKMIKEKDIKFNPGSTMQLREVLFDVLKLPVEKYTSKNSPSTDISVMNNLAEVHKVELAQQIVEYRKLTKFRSTYIEAIYEKSAFDGRVHPNYQQHRAVTGRLSSSNPNFQNIKRDEYEYKKCFLADPGMTIVKSDLAQAEFRCWAHYANDRKMIKDIESGLDIHRRTASEVFGVTEEEVTKEQRTAAKSCVFGLMFGRGTKAIAKQYNISEEDAAEIKNLFFKKYPMASLWLDKQVEHAKQFHYVKSWMGRIRRLPEIASDDQMVRAEAERQAKNSSIQGLASDMNNHYMVTTLKLAKKKGIKCYPMATIHDANVIQVKESQMMDLIGIMNYVVKTAFPGFRCQMKLDFEAGKTLGTLEKVEVSDG